MNPCPIWQKSLLLIDAFNSEMEVFRQSKVMTKNEQAFCNIYVNNIKSILDEENLRLLFKCARVKIFENKALQDDKFTLELKPCTTENWQLCPRCRRYYEFLYDEAGFGLVCERCDQVLHMMDFDNQYKKNEKFELFLNENKITSKV